MPCRHGDVLAGAELAEEEVCKRRAAGFMVLPLTKSASTAFAARADVLVTDDLSGFAAAHQLRQEVPEDVDTSSSQ
jgi:hypothetical protein